MLSDKLKQLRNTITLTQSEFAKKIDVARTTYAMYEQGNREPDYSTLQRIADYFGVTTDYLLGRENIINTITVTDQENKLTTDEEFKAFSNNPDLERWYKDLPNSEEEDLEALKQMWEIIKRNKK